MKILKLVLIILVFALSSELFIRLHRFGLHALSYQEQKSINAIYNSEFAYAPTPGDCNSKNGLVPNAEGTYYTANFSVNSWGFHDKPFNKMKSPNIVRIAVLGDSATMGVGVENNEVFVEVFEDLINSRSFRVKYEVINMAIPLSSLCPDYHLDKAAFFKPNIIMWSSGLNAVKEKVKIMAILKEFANKRKIPVLPVVILGGGVEEIGQVADSFLLKPMDAMVRYSINHYIFNVDMHPDAYVHQEIGKKLFNAYIQREQDILNLSEEANSDYTSNWHPTSQTLKLNCKNPFWKFYYYKRSIVFLRKIWAKANIMKPKLGDS